MQESFRNLKKKYYLVHKAINRPNGRRLRRLERNLESTVFDDLKAQEEYILSRARAFFEKTAEGDVDDIFDNMDDKPMINNIMRDARRAALLGGTYRERINQTADVGVTFSLTMDPIINYFEERPLLLAKMSDTTRDAIKPILVEAIKTGEAYTATAQKISNNFALSRDRAQMISVNEIGHAYEEGNRAVMQAVSDQGFVAKKRWLTVRDDKVTKACRAYESLGWVLIDKNFKYSQYIDDVAPRDSNPRCRCTIEWDFD